MSSASTAQRDSIFLHSPGHVARVAILIFACIFLAACAKQQPVQAPEKPASYPMTPEAAKVYYYLVLAEAAKTNDLRMGSEAIRQLLALNPVASVYVDAARFYTQRKESVLARDIVKRGLEAYPEHFELTMLLAETYLNEKRVDESIGILKDFIAKHPEDGAARQQLGQLLLSNNLFQEAADLLRQKSPVRNTPVTRYYLARAYVQLKKYKDAQAELKKAVQSEPEFVEAWAELAYVYELMKDYVAAEKTYEHILELGETSQEVWLRLIALNLKLNHPEKALTIAKEGPEDMGFVLQAATLFIDESFPEQARELLEPLAEMPSPPSEVFFHLALIAFNTDKDLPRAIELLENIPDHDRLWGKSVRFRTHMLFELKRYDEALELLEQGIKADPSEREFWDMRIDLLASLKRFDEAHAALDKALKRWPNDTELLFTRGSVYDLAGEREHALELMEQVITHDPEHPEALNYVGYSLADKGVDLDRALVLIESALKLEPEKAFIIDSLAWVHFKLGNLEQAWDAINRTIALGAKDPIIWEHYGDIAKAMGRKTDARKGYREALKLNPSNPDQLKKKLQGL
ncbi:tetratricopeptide repeat protein [Desulfovibrio mangrovi]|uniref:tetratricopeptide repeat protein n=1 Tax=Desulfovibrio mangrovi TaxID=2976983 RepID=UPI00224855A0|nr:tetratricopeptide repeat protein [Desulfovibrio mangrovi]UZP68480.1 tetratricopeptide repeat protein [Desulfovibrio mangrovi]